MQDSIIMIRSNFAFAFALTLLLSSCCLIQSFVVVHPQQHQRALAQPSTTARHFFPNILGGDNNDSQKKEQKIKLEQHQTTESQKTASRGGDKKVHEQPGNAPKSSSGGLIPKITTVNSLDEFLEFIQEDDRLCVIKFHASWCKSCQKFGVQFRHIAMENGDKVNSDGIVATTGNVRFAQVEFGANTILCKSLGIKKLPTVHFYKQPHGKLTGFPCGPKKFDLLVETLEEYKGMTDEELKLKKELEEGDALLDTIAGDIQKTAPSSQTETQTKNAKLN
mmetsp:Transcript_13993/g.18374  ORF Transcript_13993/g.18374 Transcript_13993/m.18374 type:complete len:278 (-) Transcript_13993:286-1119(-)